MTDSLFEEHPSGLITPANPAGFGELHVPKHVVEQREKEWNLLTAKLKRYCADSDRFTWLLQIVVAQPEPLLALTRLTRRMEQGTFVMPEKTMSFEAMLAAKQPVGPNRAQRREYKRKHKGFKRDRAH